MAITGLKITSGFTKIMGIRNWNGLYFDGGVCPYHYGSAGDGFFPVVEAEQAMRFKVKNDQWFDNRYWSIDDQNIWQSNENPCYQDYDSRIWPMSPFNVNGTLYCIGHHEWPNETGRYDVKTLVWMKSNDGGKSWFTKPYSTSYCDGGPSHNERLWIVPCPHERNDGRVVYGFFHPSNVVKDGSYWYWFAGFYTMKGMTEAELDEGKIREGFIMMRIADADLDDPTKAEVYNASQQWEGVHNPFPPYWGNDDNDPFIFCENVRDPFQGDDNQATNSQATATMATSIRYHLGTNRWVLFGVYRGSGPSLGIFDLGSALSSPPALTTADFMEATNPGGADKSLITQLAPYTKCFDPDSNEDNYQNTGSKLQVWAIKERKEIHYADIEIEWT